MNWTTALLGRVLLCVVLLAGQQAALAHPIAHVFVGKGGAAVFDPSVAKHDHPAGSSELCAFHSSLAGVLCALAHAAAPFVAPALVDVAYAAPARRPSPLAPPLPASRDPPFRS